jgi:hypothetical protein
LAVTKIWLKWDQNTIIWDQNPYTWDQVFILISTLDRVGGGVGGILVDVDRVWWDLERQLKEKGAKEEECEKLLEIVIEVNGIEKKKTRSVDCIKKEITVEHIKKTFSEIAPSIRVVAEKIQYQ